MITLGNAAKQLGVSKPTLSKAISRGHLSATRREDGSFSIDPAELMRWWESSRQRFHLQPVSHFQPSTLSDESGNSSGNPVDTVNTANPPAPVDNEVDFLPRSGGFCKEPKHPRRMEWHRNEPGGGSPASIRPKRFSA